MRPLALVLAAIAPFGHAQPPTLVTRWAAEVTATACHPEYPRPHLVRDGWRSLNGPWQYAITAGDAAAMPDADGTILVPFPLESRLSGVQRELPADHALWYRRRFAALPRAAGERLLLHFGAVDWRCRVWVDGTEVGSHQGGYDAFTFDIGDALAEDADEHEMVVRVEDPTSDGHQPRGKQVRRPGGIWYTPTSGIWQTVWLERAPASHVRRVHAVADLRRERVTVVVELGGPPAEVAVEVAAEGRTVGSARAAAAGATVQLDVAVPDPRPWSPTDPFLYDLRIRVGSGGEADDVRSCFGMREIAVARDADGNNRLFLNGEPLFHLGLLDQGFWPDGLYTAPTDAALRYDLEQTKALGFNMVRKHAKVEPARWYHHCDRIGLLVWQDMPSGDRHARLGADDIERSEASARDYHAELAAMIDGLRQHPCIVVWVPFNEGWGQFDTDAVLELVARRDPTRLVDGPSGWNDRGSGDLHDIHAYPGPAMPAPEPRRAAVLGEFGGLGLPLPGHLWSDRRNWGYRTFADREALQAAYDGLIGRLERLYAQGLAAAVYTQTTDVEGEVNGVLTYDREVVKLDAERLRTLHATFAAPPPRFVTTTLLPTAETDGQPWRYTTAAPPGDWFARDFDDAAWAAGSAGFGTEGTPGAVVRTRWDGSDIWLRRSFAADGAAVHHLHLRIHHDEDAEVYLNGELVARLAGYTTDYVELPLTKSTKLRAGTNHLAVHCRQTGGGQYVDVGLIDVERRTR